MLPCHKCMALAALSPSLWPLAGSCPAADSHPAFPLRGGGNGAPTPAVHSSAFLGRTRPGHPAYPSAGSTSKIKPHRESRPRRWACTAHDARSPPAPMGPPAAAQPEWEEGVSSFRCSPQGQTEAPHLQSAGAAGSADSAAVGPAFRWETGTEERGKKQHWQPGDCQGEFAELPSPNTRAACGTHPAWPLPCLPPRPRLQSPFLGVGDTAGRGMVKALGEAMEQAGSILSVPQFPLPSVGTHVHLVHVHDGGRGSEGAQAVPDPVLQRHAPKLAVVGGSPAVCGVGGTGQECPKKHRGAKDPFPILPVPGPYP